MENQKLDKEDIGKSNSKSQDDFSGKIDENGASKKETYKQEYPKSKKTEPIVSRFMRDGNSDIDTNILSDILKFLKDK